MMIRYSWFNFKGIYSYDMGISVSRQPDIVRPPLRAEKQTIPGRNGAIYENSDIYDAYTKTAECNVFDIKKLDDINGWLTGYGPLIFSNEKEKVYTGRVLSQIAFAKIGLVFDYKEFPIVFEVQPEKHSTNTQNDAIEFTAVDFKFMGKGNYKASPIIDVYGSGDIELNINGETILLKNIDEYITLNSKIKECYKENVNQSMKMTGFFPNLLPNSRENRIITTGSFNKIIINPNWSWI